MVRRYQALGKAKISGRRRMSYLNDAEPMSISVENRTTALAGSTALSRPLRELDAPSVVERPTGTKLTFRDRDRWNLTNSTLTLSESLRSLSAYRATIYKYLGVNSITPVLILVFNLIHSKTDAWIFETEQGPGFGLEIYSVEAGQ